MKMLKIKFVVIYQIGKLKLKNKTGGVNIYKYSMKLLLINNNLLRRVFK